MEDKKLKIGTYQFSSRLIVGTGKYDSFETMVQALEASGADMVTVAIGRVDLQNRNQKNILDFIDRKKITILPKRRLYFY